MEENWGLGQLLVSFFDILFCLAFMTRVRKRDNRTTAACFSGPGDIAKRGKVTLFFISYDLLTTLTLSMVASATLKTLFSFMVDGGLALCFAWNTSEWSIEV